MMKDPIFNILSNQYNSSMPSARTPGNTFSSYLQNYLLTQLNSTIHLPTMRFSLFLVALCSSLAIAFPASKGKINFARNPSVDEFGPDSNGIDNPVFGLIPSEIKGRDEVAAETGSDNTESGVIVFSSDSSEIE